MARTKYKQKPQFWYCVQYDGTNAAEMVAFCPQCHYDEATQKLMFGPIIEVKPTDWVLEDMAVSFSIMTNSQFTVFFDLTGLVAGAKPAPEIVTP